MRILIAEDDFTSRAMLTATLRKWGFETAAAQDGAEAWRMIQQPGAPKLILLDWNMPEMDGLEVIRLLRAAETEEPPYVILLTSKGEKESLIAGLNSGANDYIVKPYDAEELLARIRVGQRMVEMQTGLAQARRDLAYQARHDVLTGVYNRRAIMEALNREIARTGRGGGPLAVGVGDIDHFKLVNDRYGHAVGDEILCAIVRRLENGLRAYDHLGRWGGEEFLIIAPGCPVGEAFKLFDRLRTSIPAEPMPTKAGPIPVTISLGVTVGDGSQAGADLFAAADAAVYRAKDEGRNRVCLSVGTGPTDAGAA
jgi:two-component system, cell cycle response regulator